MDIDRKKRTKNLIKELSIGSLTLQNQVLTAPIAGYTSRAFRDILRAQNPGLIFGEMISAQALCYNNRKTFELLGLEGESFPTAVQLCGGNSNYMAEAAQIVEAKGANILDINMGCPAPKVVKNNEGCYLMRYPRLAGEIMERVVKSVKIPVTAKIRLGWDDNSRNFLEFSRILEAAGASAITVHGRTREQFYRGTADWSQIKAVKETVKIPVIANGDIFTPQNAVDVLTETKCDGIMLARGVLGNPWLVKDVLRGLSGLPPYGKPAKKFVLQQALAHLKEQVRLSEQAFIGRGLTVADLKKEAELAGVRSMRGQLAFYLKGMPNSAYMRNKINQLNTVAEIEDIFAQWCKIES